LGATLRVHLEAFVTFLRLTGFTRRPIPDGTTASFCNKCLDTLAVSYWEAELDRAEQAHICDPRLLEY
jgi:hypothetical protein